jgi:GNAT superfamily N-acetyltransferase
MPTVTADDIADVSAAAARRWRAIDPLLPAPGAPAGGCGAELAVTGRDGRLTAIGSCEHWRDAPGSLELTWGAATRFRLTVQTAGPDAAGALDQLLSRWHTHLAAVPEAGADDTAAVVTWPSRDVDGPLPLLRHGLAPRAVIAARPAGRRAAGPRGPGGTRLGRAADGAAAFPAPGRGVQIRRAGSADIDTVVRLGMETVRFDAHFGTVIERPWSAQALRREAGPLLAGPGGWAWLAEHDGEPAGLLYAEPPEAASWIAPMAGPAPVAYLELMYVPPAERGRGTAPALAGHLHREADAAGVAVTLLHYEQVNPLSGPFWSRQGYRPLWTSWEARPARTLR